YISDVYTDFSSKVTGKTIKKDIITIQGKNDLPWSINRGFAAQMQKNAVFDDFNSKKRAGCNRFPILPAQFACRRRRGVCKRAKRRLRMVSALQPASRYRDSQGRTPLSGGLGAAPPSVTI
ncbi:MAG TPA: hypothetical protein VN417_00215, partial [Candidatus Cryosericum sp.]|nr:hypothetical protein [Candidatus Cryosericum sp.]